MRDRTPPDPTGPDEVVQGLLPLDLDPDEPVPYRLTPQARRLVAPETVPDLAVVEATDDVPSDLDDPHDPRSARARALRRGGMSVLQISRRLGVDELVVRTWTGDLDPRGRRRPRLHAVSDGPDTAASRGTVPTDESGTASADDRLVRHRAAFARARREASDAVGPLLTNPDFLRGLALTVAAAEVDEHAVLVSLRDRAVARTVRAWLVDHAGANRGDLRVVVRMGDTAGADLELHRWAEALDLPSERVSRTRWRSAPTPHAVEVLLRVADPGVAARVTGWRDGLLGEGAVPVDAPTGSEF